MPEQEIEEQSRQRDRARAIERAKLSRRLIPVGTHDWARLNQENQLSTEEILFIIQRLLEQPPKPTKQLNYYTLIGDIYAGLDDKHLKPKIGGVISWCREQGYEMRNPPVRSTARQGRPVKASRNLELQKDANSLAERLKQSGNRRFTKGQLAIELSKKSKWCSMSAVNIERILRKEW